MSTGEQQFAFNVKAVVQETGLSPDTLRAWERRYGLPQPKRTSGGHRVYSQRDIDILKWLVARQQEGISISRAVDLWHKLEAEQEDHTPGNLLGTAALDRPDHTRLVELRDAWMSACLVYAELAAEQAITEALALYPLETVCIEILQAGLADIGIRWHKGEVSAQQEHFASTYAVTKIESLMTNAPPPTQPGKILIGTPQDEQHTFSTLVVSLFLRRKGWDVVYLGSDVSLTHLETTVAAMNPSLVILSAQHLPSVIHILAQGQKLLALGIPLAITKPKNLRRFSSRSSLIQFDCQSFVSSPRLNRCTV